MLLGKGLSAISLCGEKNATFEGSEIRKSLVFRLQELLLQRRLATMLLYYPKNIPETARADDKLRRRPKEDHSDSKHGTPPPPTTSVRFKGKHLDW